MCNIQHFCLMCLFLGLTIILNAQDIKPAVAPPIPSSNIVANSISCTIKGTVIDSLSSSALPFVTIILIDKTTKKQLKGVVSNSKGEFSIQINAQGDYSLVLQMIGYRTIQRDIRVQENRIVDLGRIPFLQATIQLQEIIVKPLIEETLTDITYNISSDPDRGKMSIQDVMRKIPLIQVQPDGSFYIESPEKKFIVVRNGRADALISGNLAQVLKALPAAGFSKLKIITDPPKRYEGIDYVLDIVSDPSVKVVGAIGNLTGNYDYETNSYSYNPSTLFSSEKLRGRISPGSTTTESRVKKSSTQQTFPNENRRMLTSDDSKSNSNGYGISSSFSYDLAKNQFVNIDLYLNKSNGSTLTDKHFEQWTNEALQKQYIKTGTGSSKGITPRIKVDYEYDFKKPERILHIGFLNNSTKGSTDDETIMNGILNFSSENNLSTSQTHSSENKLQMDYSDIFNKKLTLETGISLLRRNYFVETSYYARDYGLTEWIPDSSYYRLMDKIHFLINSYLSISWMISPKISLNSAFRAEYLNDGEGTLIKDGFNNRNISEKGLIINPTIGMSMLIGKKRFSLNYSTRQVRPSINYLDPHTDDPKGEIINIGNPYLKPSVFYNFNFRGSFFKKNPVSFTLGSGFSNNMISNYWYINEKGQTVSTYTNYGKSQSYSLSTNTSFKVRKKYSLPLSAAFSYSKLANSRMETTEGYNFQMGLSHQLSLKNNFSLSFNAWYNKMWNKGYNYVKLPPFSLRCSLNKSFFKQKILMGLTVSNLLWQQVRSTRYVNTPLFNTVVADNNSNYPVSFYASFNFGKFKVKPIKRTKRSTNIDDVLNPE